jgi:small acid-soluble spore protein H (minor)
MDASRAQEIITSKEKIEVKYQGQSVWLEGVNQSSNTARVHPVDNPSNSMTVAVDKLSENA